MSSPIVLAHQGCYQQIKRRLIDVSGLVYYEDRDDALVKTITERIATLGVASCEEYLALIQSDSSECGELDQLIDMVTIGETYFFRHGKLFDAIRQRILPELLTRNADRRRLRIWSAGCSTGAEAYSLSILLREELGPLFDLWDISIVGSDINRRVLSRASEGIYQQWAFRSTSDQFKAAYFETTDSGWQILPELKKCVSFQYHNLVQHHFPSLTNNLFAFDLILCRNVLIYFPTDVIRRLATQFRDSLTDHGWLLVGHAETNVRLFREFVAVNSPGAVLYQKADSCATPEVSAQWQPASAVMPVDEPAPPLELPRLVKPETFAEDDSPRDLTRVVELTDGANWDEAEELCRDLITEDRLTPELHYYLALILEQTGRVREALDAIRQSIYLDRSLVLGHYHMGFILQKNGKPEEAARSFMNALRLLERLPAGQPLEHGDGITVAELTDLATMQLEVMETS